MPTTVQPVIVTPSIDRLRAFYVAMFEASQTVRVPDEGSEFYVGLQVGDSSLGLVEDSGVDLTASQRIILSVDVANVDDLLHRVVAAGGTVLGPPSDMPWGQRVAHVRDPDGNAVNLTQPV